MRFYFSFFKIQKDINVLYQNCIINKNKLYHSGIKDAHHLESGNKT